MLVMGSSLNNRVTKLEARVYDEDDLEEREGLIGREMFEDMGRPNR